jgi:hypothetical protein
MDFGNDEGRNKLGAVPEETTKLLRITPERRGACYGQLVEKLKYRAVYPAFLSQLHANSANDD